MNKQTIKELQAIKEYAKDIMKEIDSYEGSGDDIDIDTLKDFVYDVNANIREILKEQI